MREGLTIGALEFRPTETATTAPVADAHMAPHGRSAFGLVRFKARETVFKQDEPCEGLLQIIEGSAIRSVHLPDGRRQVLDVLNSGALLGLPLQSRHAATITALGELRARKISRAEFHGSYRLQGAAQTQLLDQFNQLKEALVSIGKRSAGERLAILLRNMVMAQHGAEASHRDHGAPLEIALGLTYTDIADHLGLRLETVSREFSRLKSRGILRPIGRTKIEIIDASHLSRCAIGECE